MFIKNKNKLRYFSVNPPAHEKFWLGLGLGLGLLGLLWLALRLGLGLLGLLRVNPNPNSPNSSN